MWKKSDMELSNDLNKCCSCRMRIVYFPIIFSIKFMSCFHTIVKLYLCSMDLNGTKWHTPAPVYRLTMCHCYSFSQPALHIWLDSNWRYKYGLPYLPEYDAKIYGLLVNCAWPKCNRFGWKRKKLLTVATIYIRYFNCLYAQWIWNLKVLCEYLCKPSLTTECIAMQYHH